MNTQDLNNKISESTESKGLGKLALLAAAAAVALESCKKEQVGVYELNEVDLVNSGADKTRLKTNEQFVSILFTNLFQSGISSDIVFELNECFLSIGDQELAREVLISNFFNQDSVQLPSVDDMMLDLDAFVVDTYKRFFVRLPSEGEKTWVKNFITNNPYMTPELVYFSFALSHEYMYY
ncbi:MAG: hypothetical protein R2809_07000 [Flavobacteriales bacterium]